MKKIRGTLDSDTLAVLAARPTFKRGPEVTNVKLWSLLPLREATKEERQQKNGCFYWCRCDCGNEKAVRRSEMLEGRTKTCGCRIGVTKRIHGMAADHPCEYNIWLRMIGRCTNPEDHAWRYYGGRGITVCENWRASVQRFIDDMGARPGPGYSLDRIDNDGPYSPENCRWATRAQQQRNKRDNRLVEHGGQRLTIAEWSEKTGVSSQAILMRLRSGWPVEDALSVTSEEYQKTRPRDKTGRYIRGNWGEQVFDAKCDRLRLKKQDFGLKRGAE